MRNAELGHFYVRLRARKLKGDLFYGLFLMATLVGIIALVVLLVEILIDGWGWFNWHFLTSFPSRFPHQAGIKAALFGTIWVVGFAALFSLPLGVATAVYLEEYAARNWFTRAIQTNISNLAGVPSIIYGLLGLAFFVQFLALGRSVLAGAMTMTLLVLPVVIIASQEAVRAVPQTYRHGAYALGAHRWQVEWHIVLPQALPGILTGLILAMSRAIGEAAPMIALSALAYVTFVPSSPMDRFTVLPIQIFNWISRPQREFHHLAAAGIILLLLILLTMNSAAIVLRNKFQKKVED